jgi:hypothetical protein
MMSPSARRTLLQRRTYTRRVQTMLGVTALLLLALAGLGAGIAYAAGDPVPVARVEPASMDFGDVKVGMDRSLGLGVFDAGDGELNITSWSCDGPPSLRVTAPDTLRVSPWTGVQFTFCWAPTTLESLAATFTVHTDDPLRPTFVIPVSGRVVPAPVLSIPQTLEFENVHAGQPASQQIVARNTGYLPLEIYSAELVGNALSDYSLAGPGSATIAPGDSITYTLTFSPTILGPDNDVTVRFTSNDPAPWRTGEVWVHGTGVGLPRVSVWPEAIDFDYMKPGTRRSRIVDFTNTGDEPLVLSSPAITNTRGLELVAPSSSVLAPGETATYELVYKASKPGTFNSTLTVNTNDPNMPVISIPIAGSVYSGVAN